MPEDYHAFSFVQSSPRQGEPQAAASAGQLLIGITVEQLKRAEMMR